MGDINLQSGMVCQVPKVYSTKVTVLLKGHLVVIRGTRNITAPGHPRAVLSYEKIFAPGRLFPNDTLTADEIEGRSAACRQLTSTVGAIRDRFDAMSSGLNHLEQVYQEERAKQQQLVQKPQDLQ